MKFDFEKLDVYHKAIDFVEAIYGLTKYFPREERFVLVDQLRRAAISVPLNIVEGSGRTKKDFIHFLRNARSSCYECVAVLEICKRRAYISAPLHQKALQYCIDISKMVSGLINSIKGEKIVNEQ